MDLVAFFDLLGNNLALSIVVFFPLLGALALLLIPKENPSLPNRIQIYDFQFFCAIQPCSRAGRKYKGVERHPFIHTSQSELSPT